jgi:flagellar M-ring protein FliF
MVVDSSGAILSTVAAGDGSPLSKRVSSQMEYQRNIEKDLANRIQSMLEKVVGTGKVVAKVSAAVDFKVVEKTEEAYDPEEPVVRSMRRNSRKSTLPSEGGESTVAPTAEGLATASSMGREETNEVINYEINRVVSKTALPVGEVERLSVAVLVDGVYTRNDKGTEEFQPRSKEEIQTIESLVKKSVGFDAARGDQVAVTSIPFQKLELGMPSAEEGGFRTILFAAAPIMKYAASLLALILVLFFILRPLIKFILATGGESGPGTRRLSSVGAGGPQFSLEDSRLEGGGSLPELEGQRFREVDNLRHLAGQDAREFAELLKTWLK